MAELDWIKKGYKIIDNFFTKEELEILQHYTLKKLEDDKTYLVDPDTESPGWYKDALASTFLHLKKPLVEKASGYKLFPAYTYWRYYCFGGKLGKHTDRPSCEISITANIKSNDKWPIVVEGRSIDLKEGQAVLYLGCIAEHWRPGKYKGEGMAQVFLHYVNVDGPFAHHNNDYYFYATDNISSKDDEKKIRELKKKFKENNK